MGKITVSSLKNSLDTSLALCRQYKQLADDRRALHCKMKKDAAIFLVPFYEFIVANPDLYDAEFLTSAKIQLRYPNSNTYTLTAVTDTELVFQYKWTKNPQWDGDSYEEGVQTLLVPFSFLESPDLYRKERAELLEERRREEEAANNALATQRKQQRIEELQEELKGLSNAKT